jgi:hypothetical protein
MEKLQELFHISTVLDLPYNLGWKQNQKTHSFLDDHVYRKETALLTMVYKKLRHTAAVFTFFLTPLAVLREDWCTVISLANNIWRKHNEVAHMACTMNPISQLM